MSRFSCGWRRRHDRHRGRALRRPRPVPRTRAWPVSGSGKPVFLYNLLNLKRTIWSGPELSPGKHTIVFDFKSDGPAHRQGRDRRAVRGWQGSGPEVHGSTRCRSPSRRTKASTSAMGDAYLYPMLEYRYDPPFKFTGKINKLTFKLSNRTLSLSRKQRRSWDACRHLNRIRSKRRNSSGFSATDRRRRMSAIASPTGNRCSRSRE